VAEALRYFDGERAAIISSVVMPNHAHALFVQNADWPLETLLRSWKALLHGKQTRYWGATAVSGSGIISID
jgi:hypothetical protein